MKKTMIDPPSGWKYGFPKPMPEDVENVREWLIEQGYPEEIIKAFEVAGVWHYRTWEQTDDAN